MNLFLPLALQIILINRWYGKVRASIALKFMFSALTIVCLYGFCSFVAGLSENKVGINQLGYGVSACLIVCWTIRWIGRRRSAHALNLEEPSNPGSDGIYVPLILGIGLCLGILNFGLEFTPSSMTGDPPRHFARALGFFNENAAAAWKPIYPLTVAGWLGLTAQLDPVLSFTLFNVLVLGGVGALLYMILCQVAPATQGYRAFCVASVCMAGYPQFALQYGYFALNLAAVYFFATMLALLLWSRNRDFQTYSLSIILGTGVVLTHGYLLPPLLIMHSAIFVHTNFFSAGKSLGAAFLLKLGWLIAALSWYLVLSMLSNDWMSIDRLEGQLSTLKLRGLVNESFFLNISPFLPLAALSLFFYGQSNEKRLLTYTAWLTLLYAVSLFMFGLLGLMTPYYTNRIQVILLPMLIVLNAIVLQDVFDAFKMNSVVIFTIALLGVLGLYWGYQSAPLQLTKETFLSLLRKDEFVYFENATNAGFSPLQLTPLDTRLLKAIRQNDRICFDQPLTSVAVLGTDHSTQWFEHLTGIRPSLFDRTDGYIEFRGYLRNFNLWLDSPVEKYIVITSHFDFWNRSDILAKISDVASPVCAGDAVTIYRKNLPFGEVRR